LFPRCLVPLRIDQQGEIAMRSLLVAGADRG
jgi:hypothetical protein